MPATPRPAARAVARATRSAPLAPLAAIDAASGSDTAAALRGLRSRGVCCDVLTAAAGRGDAVDVWGHRALPPSVIRVCGTRLASRTRDAVVGSAAWASRTGHHPGAARRIVAHIARAATVAGAPAVSSGDIAIFSARSSGAAPALLARLAEAGGVSVPYLAQHNPATPRWAVEVVAAVQDMPGAVTTNTNCPPGLLRRAIRHQSEQVRCVAAANPALEGDLIDAAARDASVLVVSAAARNPAVDPETVRWLAGSGGEGRKAAAGSANCPSEILAALSADPDAMVRRRVAANPSTPADALLTLTATDTTDIRLALAGNLSLSAEAARRLAGDRIALVRAAAAKHPVTPIAALEAMLKDRSATMRQAAAAQPRWSDAQLRLLAADPEWRAAVASNEKCSPDLLAALSTDPDAAVRMRAAANPSNSRATLAALARDTASMVRKEVSLNHSASPETLLGLIADDDSTARAAVRELLLQGA